MFVTGQFGYVYKGFLKLDEQKEDVEVAVKTLKSWSGKSFNQRSVTANIKIIEHSFSKKLVPLSHYCYCNKAEHYVPLVSSNTSILCTTGSSERQNFTYILYKRACVQVIFIIGLLVIFVYFYAFLLRISLLYRT